MRASLQYFILALTALLPLINPFGSALVLLGMVGQRNDQVYRQVAGRVALSTIVFLMAIEFLGASILRFFGIALPMVQVAGGLVIAFTAWTLLFQKDAQSHTEDKRIEAGLQTTEAEDLSGQTFYPYTFPITAGPGALVTMLTLSARASEQAGLTHETSAHVGIGLALCVLAALVYVCYRFAPRIVRIMSPSMAHGVLRVISFLLLCLGIQILWSGVQSLQRV